MATGRYLQFVDADDMLIKDAYDYCISIARSEQPEMILFDFTKTDIQPAAIEPKCCRYIRRAFGLADCSRR